MFRIAVFNQAHHIRTILEHSDRTVLQTCYITATVRSPIDANFMFVHEIGIELQSLDTFRAVKGCLLVVICQHLAAVGIQEWFIVIPIRHNKKSKLICFAISVRILG
ncbi:hypothetical protein D3C80_1479600 [compost metagenome]